MNNTTKNILIGSFAAIACAAIVILAIEEKKSFLQILSGFAIFVFPFTFLSSFGSKIGSFIFVFCTLMAAYLVSKFMYEDFWIGVLLASIIGGSAFYFRVYKYKPFSASEYKQRAKEEHNKIK
jgi:predicted neutral ceramidase superfamily lipid hydrolase